MGGGRRLGDTGEPTLGAGDPAYRPEPTEPPQAQHRRLFLPTVPHRQKVQIDLFEFVNLAADMALDGVEPTSYYFPPDVTPDYLNRLKLHAFTLGLDISGHGRRQQFLPATRDQARRRDPRRCAGSTSRPSSTLP